MNKYKDKSRVDEYEHKDEVDKCNEIDFNFTGRIRHMQCLTCANACPDLEFNLTGTCVHYKERLSLIKINREIKKQNINIRRLCKKNNLKYFKMMDMIHNKMIMKFKYYKALENRICEKIDEEKEYIKFMKAVGGMDGK